MRSAYNTASTGVRIEAWHIGDPAALLPLALLEISVRVAFLGLRVRGDFLELRERVTALL